MIHFGKRFMKDIQNKNQEKFRFMRSENKHVMNYNRHMNILNTNCPNISLCEYLISSVGSIVIKSYPTSVTVWVVMP